MRILFIGDVIAKPGLTAVQKLLPDLRKELGLDVVVANGENSAGGAGITEGSAKELFKAGVDLLTTGNHVWHHRDVATYLSQSSTIVRPANFPAGVPGKAAIVAEVAGFRLLLTNVLGRVFMTPLDDPFVALDRVLDDTDDIPMIIVVDVHAEATSEKRCLGFYLDGRASLVVGTHTHVPTADQQVLPKGTAYVTDVGMVGPLNSSIGVEYEPVIHKFITGMPQRFGTASDSRIQFNSVLAEVDAMTGRATGIERVDRFVDIR